MPLPPGSHDWTAMAGVGRIARPQGNRGEVIVDPATDFPDERFAAGNTVFVERGGRVEALTIAEYRMHTGRPVIRIDGVETMDGAEALRGLELRVPEDALQPLPEGMWYHHELIGCRVVVKDGGEVGTVRSIYGPTERSLLEVEGPEKNDGPILVPLTAAYVAVDVAARVVTIDPPAGLLEVNRPERRGAE